jgi:hypothetical protein
MSTNEHSSDAEIRAEAFGLERRAMSPAWAVHDTPSEAEIELSKAVSLKRIADALWGIEGTSGLLELLNPLDVRNNY